MEPCIRSDELFARLGDDELLVLDLREEEDWNLHEVHIPGSLRMTLSEIAECAGALPDDELIVLVGHSGVPNEVRRAYRLLRMRSRMAVCLDGGLKEWVRQGYPIERHARKHLKVAEPARL